VGGHKDGLHLLTYRADSLDGHYRILKTVFLSAPFNARTRLRLSLEEGAVTVAGEGGHFGRHAAYWRKKWSESHIDLWSSDAVEALARAYTCRRSVNIRAGRENNAAFKLPLYGGWAEAVLENGKLTVTRLAGHAESELQKEVAQ
jgi:hypothetical protein